MNSFGQNKNHGNAPDFNYPKTVISNSETAMQAAIEANDGKELVKHLVRYSIAQSMISDDNASLILAKIDQTLEKEKAADTRALLFYFKAFVINSFSNELPYSRKNATDGPVSADPSEWDRAQCKAMAVDCCQKAIAEARSAKDKKITDYKEIISFDSAVSPRLCPSIYDFIVYKSLDLFGRDYYTDYDSEKTAIFDEWKNSNAGNEEASIFVDYNEAQCDMACTSETWKNLYLKHKDNELSGLLLDVVKATIDNHTLFKEYLEKYPESVFAGNIRNKIKSVERKSVDLHLKRDYTSAEKIAITASADNAQDFTVAIYSIPSDTYYNRNIQFKQLTLVAKKEVHLDAAIPFERKETTVEFDALPYGAYVAIPDFEGHTKNTKISTYDSFVVSDLATFSICTNKNKSMEKLYVVNMIDGKPMKGVRIRHKNVNLGVTDSDGCLKTKSENSYRQLYAVLGDDKFHTVGDAHICNYRDSSYSFETFTDLSIYRPGETVNFSAILYKSTKNSRSAVDSTKVEVEFYDSNHEEIESKTFTTDKFGRINGSFVVPTDRMNGRFRIIFSAKKGWLRDASGSHYIVVSEYKTPSFIVDLGDTKTSFAEGEPLEIKGKVTTYSGAPVAGADVTINLSRQFFWWWRDYAPGDFICPTAHATSDEAGNFSAIIDSSGFKEATCFTYIANAKCTDAAGETQSAKARFHIGNPTGVNFISSYIEHINDKALKLPIKYTSSDPSATSGECEYIVTTADETVVKEGRFDSGKPEIDLTSLKSAKYKVKIRTVGDSATPYSVASLVLYRNSDKSSPVKAAMWLPEAGRTATEKEAKISIATNCNAYIHYVAASRTKTIGEGWIKYEPGFHDFKIDMPKGTDEFVRVHFTCVSKGEMYSEEVSLESPKEDVLTLTAESFRDKIGSGEREKWTFSLRDKDGKPVRAAMLLEMVNKAITDIQPNPWNFVANYTSYTAFATSHPCYNVPFENSFHASLKQEKGFYPNYPELNTYGYSLFGFSRRYDNMVLYSAAPKTSAKLKAKASTDSEIMEEAADYDSAPKMSFKSVAGNGIEPEAKADGGTAIDNVQLRNEEVKTALWMPDITSNDDGSVTVEFDAPNFNTTWLIQAVAYSSSLATSKWQNTMVTNKPIMVKANAPRFLRGGDSATMAASVQNVSDDAQRVTAVIEVINPRTEEVYATKTFSLDIEPMRTEVVKIDYSVPADVAFIGLRVKAANATTGDGEQVMIPVLTDVSPVIETKPFYINAGEGSFSTEMPNMPKDSRVTLEYCDNPVWYCVTALPTIMDEDASCSTSLAHNLFALAIAKKIAHSNPEIKEAVDYWTQHPQDSTLCSMLEKNADLKIGTLLASPWINDAERQTLRMSKLHELFDEKLQQKNIDKMIGKLGKLQMPDGGFRWIDASWLGSSLWATSTVLELIGRSRSLGCLTDNSKVESMVKKALHYFDTETCNEYEKHHKEHPEFYSDYAYVRSMYKDYAFAGSAKSLYDKVLKAMQTTWKDRDIASKATYALTLKRGGYPTAARDIMESVRQFAIIHPTRGMYWDNINKGSGRGYFKVTTTSFVLQAFKEISYHTEEIDQIRKWILLDKQSNDWGGSSLAADAVHSLMLTGTNWTRKGEMPQITIGGNKLQFDQMESHLGYGRRTISAETSGESLVINRGQSQSPAWGSVYCQYKAQMTQIASAKTDDISIEKEFYLYGDNGQLTRANTFKVGDKVQVRCIIKPGKSVQYLTLTDERAACFEPVDKTSNSKAQDGSYYYLEVKDSSTNSFFYHLNKGTFMVSYDVYVTMPGSFSSGIATIQSQYAPQITAHSAGTTIKVE